MKNGTNYYGKASPYHTEAVEIEIEPVTVKKNDTAAEPLPVPEKIPAPDGHPKGCFTYSFPGPMIGNVTVYDWSTS